MCPSWTPTTNAAILPHPRLQASYPPFARFVSPPPHISGCFPILSASSTPPPRVSSCFPIPAASSYPLTRSGFFNGMPEIFQPGALNYYTLSHLILWILFVFRNPTLTHLPLSGSLDSLLCDLIALTSGLAFFLLMTRTLAVASLFLSGRAYPSMNFLRPFFA